MITAHSKFTRQLRLLSKQDYQAVFQHAACRSSDQQLTLLARKNGFNHARLGLAIGKRTDKTAVARNRIKRQVRESFRHHQGDLRGLDIVVLGREGTAKCNNPELRQSLQSHWQRVIKQCADC